jgi:hypothetical protein
MTEAIERLWNDPELRKRLGKAAYDHAVKHCSDEAAGVHLERILNNLEDEYSSEEIYKVA